MKKSGRGNGTGGEIMSGGSATRLPKLTTCLLGAPKSPHSVIFRWLLCKQPHSKLQNASFFGIAAKYFAGVLAVASSAVFHPLISKNTGLFRKKFAFWGFYDKFSHYPF